MRPPKKNECRAVAMLGSGSLPATPTPADSKNWKDCREEFLITLMLSGYHDLVYYVGTFSVALCSRNFSPQREGGEVRNICRVWKPKALPHDSLAHP